MLTRIPVTKKGGTMPAAIHFPGPVPPVPSSVHLHENARKCTIFADDGFCLPYLNTRVEPLNVPEDGSKNRDLPAQASEKPSLVIVKPTRNVDLTNEQRKSYKQSTRNPR